MRTSRPDGMPGTVGSILIREDEGTTRVNIPNIGLIRSEIHVSFRRDSIRRPGSVVDVNTGRCLIHGVLFYSVEFQA